MLIPPSVLMIVWCVLTEISIGKMFLAGVIPGLIAAGGMIVYVVIAAILKPELVGESRRPLATGAVGADVSAAPTVAPPVDEQPIGAMLFSTLLVILLVAGVLGAIWLGVCTPTEGASVGAVGSLILALDQGDQAARSLASRARCRPHLRTAAVAAVLRATLFARVGDDRIYRGRQGVPVEHRRRPLGHSHGHGRIWFVLGCLIDSISIILLTVPIFAPIANHLGFDPLAFAIMGILAIETGLLTPPFGILVFTVKAAVPDRSVTLAEIFRGSIPYWIVLLVVVVALAVFPQLATFLPNL